MVVKYRADIDGLRAVAVLMVVLFHFNVPPFTGGYVGVDVFFVISGFLITSMILPDMVSGQFSLLTFYERRICRIFPALFAMLIVSAAAACVLLLPPDFRDFSQGLVASTLFSSNILFWLKSGYFDAPAHMKPLLHTWSLAVEEQFYVFFPLLLWLVARTRALKPAIACLAVASFALSLWEVSELPVRGFYLIQSRAWELLLGAGLAAGLVPAVRSVGLRNGLAAAGLAAILASGVIYSRDTLFPGLAAIPPCFGAALLLWAGRDGVPVVARALSLRPVVFVGRASYSLYLWHWPVLVFAKFYLVRALTLVEAAGLFTLSFGLAVLSLRFVESVFRRRDGGLTRNSIFAASAVTAAAILFIGVAGHVSNGFSQRFSPDVQKLIAGLVNRDDERVYCESMTMADVRQQNTCPFGGQSKRPDVLVWGDSHANMLAPVFKALAETSGRTALMVRQAGCPPLLGVQRADLPRGIANQQCDTFNDAVIETIEALDIRTVVLAARWTTYAIGWDREGVELGPQPFLRDAHIPGVSQRESEEVVRRGFERTLARLTQQGRKVWIVDEGPIQLIDGPQAVARSRLYGRDLALFELEAAHHRARNGTVGEILTDLATRWPFKRLDKASLLCSVARCRLEKDGRSLYIDNNHLSAYGALFLQPLFAPIFAGH